MKTLLKLEEFALLALSIYLAYTYSYSLVWYAVFFFSPDISMLGYLGNNKVGAVVYNFFHHRLTAIAALAASVVFSSPILLFIGLLLLGHISFDRMLGYGLKYPTSFHDTHLGKIGKAVKH